jgi:hypothetical protein
MPDEVVTLCRDEADAVTHSLNFAKARFGLTHQGVAIRCGWKSASYLSEIAHGTKKMPEERVDLFVKATGCNLLQQLIQRRRIEERIAGKETANERNRAVLARMLAVAA